MFIWTYLAGRTNCRSNDLWLGWCANHTTGRLLWLEEMSASGSISHIPRIFLWGHPCRFHGASIALSLQMALQIYPIPVVSLSTVLPQHTTDSLLFPSPLHLQNLLYFPLPGRSMHLPLKPSLLLSLLGSVDHKMFIFYLIVISTYNWVHMFVFLNMGYLTLNDFFSSSIYLPSTFIMSF